MKIEHMFPLWIKMPLRSFLLCLFVLLSWLQVGVIYGKAEKKCSFTADSLWQICGNENTTESECLKLSCCNAPKSFLTLRNLTWQCLKPLKKKKISNGTCVYYKGTACQPYLEGTESNTSHVLRYIDTKIGIARTDEIFKKFYRALAQIEFTESKCSSLFKSAICKYGFPKCRIDNTSEPICREDCDFIYKMCGQDIKQLLILVQWIIITENINFSHLILPDCTKLRYSDEVGQDKRDKCGYLFSDIDRRIQTVKDSSSKENHVIYIATVVAGLLVTIALIAVCYVRHRFTEKKNRNIDLDFLSVRDRIRCNSRNNPLLELLASSKPGELVQYPLDCVEYIQDLGEGQFGKVFQGRVHGIIKGEESTDVAVKCLKEGSSTQALDEFNQEVALMAVLCHKNVLRLLAVSTEEEPYCMIFEFMENGDLNQYLRRWKDRLYEDDLVNICKHVARGMEYLSSKKFLHRDLATRNCLVGNNLLVKIADFGMSKNIYHSDYYRIGGDQMLPIRWLPPEAILYGKFTVASDVYSYGILMWEVFAYALQPFYGYSNEEVVGFISNEVLLQTPDDCPSWIYEVMLSCWTRDIDTRTTFTNILKRLNSGAHTYDIPIPHRQKFELNYNVIEPGTSPISFNGAFEADTDSNHDAPNTDLQDNTSKTTLEEIDREQIRRSLALIQINDLPYENFKDETPSESVTLPTTPPLPPINKVKKEPEYLNISPSSTSGEINRSYNNDNMTTLRPSDSPKRKTSKIRDAINAKTARRLSQIDLHTRTASLGGGKSIKDVLKNNDRYVKTDSMKKLSIPRSCSDSISQILDQHTPSAEFLDQFHSGSNMYNE